MRYGQPIFIFGAWRWAKRCTHVRLIAHHGPSACHLQLNTMRSQKLFIVGAATIIYGECFGLHFLVYRFWHIQGIELNGERCFCELVKLMLCALFDQFELTKEVLEITHKQRDDGDIIVEVCSVEWKIVVHYRRK